MAQRRENELQRCFIPSVRLGSNPGMCCDSVITQGGAERGLLLLEGTEE